MTHPSNVVTEVLRDGTHVLVRPISKGDVQLERDFIERLSPQSRRFRFLGAIKSPSEALLKQLTDIDESSEAAFIALVADSGHKREIGVARFSAQPGGSAEVAVTVDDHWQGKGLATLLMKRLIEVARRRGIERLYSTDAADNHAMRDLATHLGFSCKPDPDDATQVVHSLDLSAARHV